MSRHVPGMSRLGHANATSQAHIGERRAAPLVFELQTRSASIPGQGSAVRSIRPGACAVAVALVTAWCVLSPPVSRADSTASSTERGCTVVAAAGAGRPAPLPAGLELSEKQRRKLLRPITEAEVVELLGLLEPVKRKDGSTTLRGRDQRTKLSYARASVILGDVTSLLAGIHAGELRGQLADLRALSPDARAWMRAQIDIIEGCLPALFADRGGPDALAQSLRIVEKHRAQLESRVLGSGGWSPEPLSVDPLPVKRLQP